ncbi:histidine--tRNA ligase [Jannaschia donghaensis]|uniref:Histidine--tRNA ligase n=1 Tax=Jannaschia donghaensis TaxID=420998 RepID=A0A0M6YI15_9RHOB|nr:histidine--tRNA ligase [Jannaschia donghaensis]CTQ49590.1 Histidine--tRNA ligase [Jannaschia donghaensis]
MAKKDKIRRPKAETPKGFRDYFGAEVTQRKAMLDKIAEVYHLYGFEALESSAVETVESLGSFLPDVDRPNAGVFAWQEGNAPDGDWMALRYDLTAPLARVYAQHRNDLPTPYRRYAMGPVWRNEKPGPGRFRQFYQCDADTVGTSSTSYAADAEVCAMLGHALEAVGITSDNYVIQLNDRRLLSAILDIAEVPTEGDARGIVLRAIDKIDRLQEHGVRDLLGEGRKDDSGDYTKGAGLSASQINIVMGLVLANDRLEERLARRGSRARDEAQTDEMDALDAARYSIRSETKHRWPDYGNGRRLWNFEMIEYLRELYFESDDGKRGVEALAEMVEILTALGRNDHRLRVNPSVVRGLGYYTGPVYEAELTFEIEDDKGRPRQFGSVAGGGRYDDLVTRFTGQAVPATGVSIGVDRLLAALTAKGRIDTSPAGPVIVTVMDRDRMADYQSIVGTLRQAGIRAEVYLGNPKNFGNQLKYADKRGSPAAIIQGTDEAARDVVQVKDLILGAKLAQDASLEEWKENPSQSEVPLAELVPFLQKLLS